ncbi:Hypothetical predicted protein [Xyrichtys novacula]|uniref:Chemokine interleukin-8-like domain-containing protein n=1 Tax=Xyrichtys novacula TaxID=13765 RepID=A0AAV1FTB2_XYRNO|nr:Hypothetical predicted protein [Xyrichtys novacula]
MRMQLSAGHWLCLLTFAGVMLITDSMQGMVNEGCCLEAGLAIPGQTIIECIKQKPTRSCNSDNFAVKVESGDWFCIDSKSKWMKQQIQQGKVSCTEKFVFLEE